MYCSQEDPVLTAGDKALLLQAQIAQMKGPENRPLVAFRDFVKGSTLGSKNGGANRNGNATST